METVEIEKGLLVQRGVYGQPCVVVGIDRNIGAALLLPLGPNDDAAAIPAYFNINHRTTGCADVYIMPDGRRVQTEPAMVKNLTLFRGHK